jgi:hypothetical protein
MSAFHNMGLPITSHEMSVGRYLDNLHAVTQAALDLHIQGGTPSAHGKTVKEVQITFGKPPASGSRQIGYVQESADEATVVVTVPAAEFEAYLAILHDDPQAYVYCGTDLGASTLGYFNLATKDYTPAK